MSLQHHTDRYGLNIYRVIWLEEPEIVGRSRGCAILFNRIAQHWGGSFGNSKGLPDVRFMLEHALREEGVPLAATFLNYLDGEDPEEDCDYVVRTY